MDYKFVSIGMPVYNGEQWIRRALESLLSQTYKNFELIISDDGSSDKTFSICEEYARGDRRIRLIGQEKNLGFVGNFDFVLKQAKGEYFMWAAQDDFWHPEFIEKMARALDNNPEYGVAMSHFKVFREGSGEAQDTPLGNHDFTGKSYYELYEIISQGAGNPIFEYGLLRRELLLKLFSRFKPKCWEDTLIMMSEWALSTRFYSVKEVLHIKYRNPLPLKDRHYLGKYLNEKRPFTRHVFIMLYWLLSSPNIFFTRKVFIFWPWFKRFWKLKGKVLREVTNYQLPRPPSQA